MIRLRAIGIAIVGAGLLGACGDRAEPAPATATPANAPPKEVATTPPTTAAESADTAYPALDASIITASDTLDSLRARHGAANVVATRVPGAEGEEFDGWQLFPDDPARRVHVYLDEAGVHPQMVRVLDAPSRWRRDDGVRMGLRVPELVRRNGATVEFSGFGWDYGGACCDWHDGALARDPPLGGMTLCEPEGAPYDDPAYPGGDVRVDSDNPWVRAHPPAVCDFTVVLAPVPETP